MINRGMMQGTVRSNNYMVAALADYVDDFVHKSWFVGDSYLDVSNNVMDRNTDPGTPTIPSYGAMITGSGDSMHHTF